MPYKFDAGFFKRLGFYLLGFGIGIFILGRFYDKKNASFDYLPNARTLKSILARTIIYSDSAKIYMEKHHIDTTAVMSLLHHGNVNFSPENRGKAPCHTYLIEPTRKTAKISIRVKRCDSIATVIAVKLHNTE